MRVPWHEIRGMIPKLSKYREFIGDDLEIVKEVTDYGRTLGVGLYCKKIDRIFQAKVSLHGVNDEKGCIPFDRVIESFEIQIKQYIATKLPYMDRKMRGLA